MHISKFSYVFHKLPINVFLSTLISALFLSACGVKGDLYQTPKQPIAESEAVELSDKTGANNSPKIMQATAAQSTEQPKE